jgi:hypothetical protein
MDRRFAVEGAKERAQRPSVQSGDYVIVATQKGAILREYIDMAISEISNQGSQDPSDYDSLLAITTSVAVIAKAVAGIVTHILVFKEGSGSHSHPQGTFSVPCEAKPTQKVPSDEDTDKSFPGPATP